MGSILLDDPDMAELLKQSCAKTEAFAKVFMSDAFTAPFTPMHRELMRRMDSLDSRRVLEAAPRGFGKTTIMSAYLLRKICYRLCNFALYISFSATKALEQTENIKYELENNERIKEIFGELKGDPWSKEGWVTKSGIKVLPRGGEQQVRGANFRNMRPDEIVIDDYEDKDEVKNEEIRDKKKRRFYTDILRSVKKFGSGCYVRMIGTVLHEDSLLQNLIDECSWDSEVLEICNDEFESNWPELYTQAELIAIYEEHKRLNIADEFYMELRNKPFGTPDDCFKKEYFQYYEDGYKSRVATVKNIVIIDPAKTVKMHSAESGIVGIGIDTANNRIYVRDVIAEMYHPDELYKVAFDMCERLGANELGVEVTSLNEFITQPLENEKRRRGVRVKVTELKARGKKEERVRALIPYYKQKLVYHASGKCGKLEAQLLSFPRSKRWDAMDALAYVVEYMGQTHRYMRPKGRIMDMPERPDEREYEMLRKLDEPAFKMRSIV